MTDEPQTEAGRRLVHWDVAETRTLSEHVAAIEAEMETILRQRGWQDEYEVETAAAMNHGNGAVEARQQGRDHRTAELEAALVAITDPNGLCCCRNCACGFHSEARRALAEQGR